MADLSSWILILATTPRHRAGGNGQIAWDEKHTEYDSGDEGKSQLTTMGDSIYFAMIAYVSLALRTNSPVEIGDIHWALSFFDYTRGLKDDEISLVLSWRFNLE